MDLFDIRSQLNSGKSIYDIPLRVTYYARVSTDKDEQLHSLSAQVKYYSDFISNNPNWTFVEGYIDEGLSGTSVAKREAFLRMVDDAKLGKFDFIVTKEISRFSRNTLDSIKYTQDLLVAGVGVLFQSDNINTLYPDSELRLTIMSSIAQDEVRKTSERVRFGFKRAIENGVVLGSSRIWGYKKDNGKLVIIEEEAEMIRKIFDMYANEDLGIRAVSLRLNELGYKNTKGNDFSFSTIKGILVNPKYKGYYCGNKTHKIDYKRSDVKYIESSEWVMYKDEEAVPPIVSEELWDKANRILKKRSDKMASEDRTSYQNKYTYSGKIICTEHSVPYYRGSFRYKSGTKEVWQCKLYSEKGTAACTSPIIYTSEISDIMRQIMDVVIQDKARIIHDLVKMYSDISAKSNIASDIAKLKVEINSILKMKNKLLDLNMKGKVSDDEFESRNNGFNEDVESMRLKIKEYENQDAQNKDFAEQIEVLRKVIADELSFDDAISEGIVESLLDRIEVYKTEDKNKIKLKVFLKVLEDTVDYDIQRFRGKTSVCSTANILSERILRPKSALLSAPKSRA